MENRVMGKREIFLDRLRVLSACAVVLLHTITAVMDNWDMSGFPVQYRVFLAGMDLTTWCVPVFIMISGYLFLNPERELSLGVVVKKYCRRIVLALLLFGIPFGCLELIAVERSFRPGMLWESLWLVLNGHSWSHMWYLYLILVLYVFTPLLKRILGVLPRYGVYLLLGGLFIGSSITDFLNKLFLMDRLPVLPDNAIYLFYYLWGYLLVTGKAAHRNPLSDRAASVLALCLCAGMAGSRLAGDYSVRMAYNYPPTVLLAILLFHLARSREGSWQKSTEVRTTELAKLSFAVYLIHPLFLNIFYKLLHITPLAYPLSLSLPLFYVTVLALSAVSAWLLWKVPALGRYVL